MIFLLKLIFRGNPAKEEQGTQAIKPSGKTGQDGFKEIWCYP